MPKYDERYEQVKNTFRKFENVIVVRGVIPEILSDVDTAKASFLHIDLNSAGPEIAAGEYFWPKMIKGGNISRRLCVSRIPKTKRRGMFSRKAKASKFVQFQLGKA